VAGFLKGILTLPQILQISPIQNWNPFGSPDKGSPLLTTLLDVVWCCFDFS